MVKGGRVIVSLKKSLWGRYRIDVIATSEHAIWTTIAFKLPVYRRSRLAHHDSSYSITSGAGQFGRTHSVTSIPRRKRRPSICTWCQEKCPCPLSALPTERPPPTEGNAPGWRHMYQRSEIPVANMGRRSICAAASPWRSSAPASRFPTGNDELIFLFHAEETHAIHVGRSHHMSETWTTGFKKANDDRLTPGLRTLSGPTKEKSQEAYGVIDAEWLFVETIVIRHERANDFRGCQSWKCVSRRDHRRAATEFVCFDAGVTERGAVTNQAAVGHDTN